MTDNNESVRGRVVAWMLEYIEDGEVEREYNGHDQFSFGRRGGQPLVLAADYAALQSDLAAAIARAEAAEAKLAAIDALPVETITQMKGVGAGAIPYSWDDPAFDHCYARIVPCDKQGVTLMSSRCDAAIAAQQAEGE